MVADPWIQWDHIATDDDDDALGDNDDDDRSLSGTSPSLELAEPGVAGRRVAG